MRAFIGIELTQVAEVVVVVIDGNAENAETLARELRALDPTRREFWRIEGAVAHSCNEIVFSEASARAIQRHVRAYVGSAKSKASTKKFIATGATARTTSAAIPLA